MPPVHLILIGLINEEHSHYHAIKRHVWITAFEQFGYKLHKLLYCYYCLIKLKQHTFPRPFK